MTERRSLPLVSGGAEDEWARAIPVEDDGWDAGATLYRVVPVRVGEGGFVEEADAGDRAFARGEVVTIEREGAREIGVVTGAARRILSRSPLPRVLRRATDDDVRLEASLRRREQQAYEMAKRLVSELGLAMRIVRVSAAKGAHKLTIFFAAEERVDARELLRRLGPRLQARLELRAVGMRDAAKMVGGVGPCGLQLCCNTFLKDFAPVGIKMAKDQGLSLSPSRVSGVCGRLLCCLVYEEAYYRQQRELLPRPGRRVGTPEGPGKVIDVDVLAGQVTVALDSGAAATFAAAQITKGA